MHRILISLIVALVSVFSYAADKQYVDLGAKIVQIGGKSILAVSFKNEKKWHTYWKNPGDAGLAIKVKFKINDKEIDLKDYPWPAPKRYIEQGNMWAYGYSDKYALFFDAPKTLKNTDLTIIGEWLVCKDICIPGTRTISLKIDNNLTGKQNSLLSDSSLLEAFSFLPKKVTKTKVNLFLTKSSKANQLVLQYIVEDADFTLISKKKNLVTPYHAFPFDYKHEDIYLDKKNKTAYGRMLIDWDGVFEDPVWPLPADGIFKKPIATKFLIQYPKNTAQIIEKTFDVFSLTGNDSFNNLIKDLPKLGEKKKGINSPDDDTDFGIWKFVFFAFLGGLILNLMPCVLPVISLKLFGLIVHSEESKKQIFRHNLFYTFGVLFSFTILATVVFFLKESGEKIGWGFQLQSSVFVFAMLLIIYILALNMLGLFEFITPGGKRLGNTQVKTGVYGDFINGILATILSTPCSAPFLGSALPFAFTSTTSNIYLIFISVGLGLSFPFIITGIFPSLIKLLPKPGAWMDKLKKILGVSMLLTAVWLYDVLSALMSMEYAGIYINTLLTLIFFAFYFRKNISKNILLNLIIFVLPILLTTHLIKNNSFATAPTKSSAPQGINDLTWNKWSPQSMTDAKAAKGITFINFTASWCLTCKVNKKLVLASDDFKDLVNAKNINLLEGDWTKRDDEITDFLRQYNIAGVPAYFIVMPDGSVKSLGETITINKIKENL